MAPSPTTYIDGPNENLRKQFDPVTRLASMAFNSITDSTCPYETADLRGWNFRKLLLKPAEIVLQGVTWLLPKQRNSIAMIAERPKENHPWINESTSGQEPEN